MDSLSQIALGAAVGMATMGRRPALWKAALWGGIAGTLPCEKCASRRTPSMHERHGHAWITDLRMGQEPHYTFSFVIARRNGEGWVPVQPQGAGSRGDVGRALAWLWQRLPGRDIPPPF